MPPNLEGYKLLEQRRETGTRGGIATYVKNQLKIERSEGNEYGISTKVMLPNS
jgi:hypothetical protein